MQASYDIAALRALALECLASSAQPAGPASAPPRLLSIWEITTWILPMAPEHLRRVLAAEPDLPQGSAGAEGGTRWFTLPEVARLRAHFAPRSRRARYQPRRPAGALAPLIALTGPNGGSGRSTALLHLATAAALAGYRVLVIDADPAGRLAKDLGTEDLAAVPGDGVLSLIAQSCGQHLRRINAARLDRGEAPLAMDDTLSAALSRPAGDLIRPSRWPGLEVMPATPGLMPADLQISAWHHAMRGWRPWSALASGLTAQGWRQSYDLILCDTGRGLGPLALAVLASADVLLAPLPLHDAGAGQAVGAGLQSLARVLAGLEAEEQGIARAIGQPPLTMRWRKLALLLTRFQSGAAMGTVMGATGFAAKPAMPVLPAALPEITQIAAQSQRQFYDMDYRQIGRLAYAPMRQACDEAWRGLAALLEEIWAEDPQPPLL